MGKKDLKDRFAEAEKEWASEAMLDEKKRTAFIEAYAMLQALTIMRFGETPDWENLSTQEKVYHGHLRGGLYAADALTVGRWQYWLDIRATQVVIGKPIPQVRFLTSGDEGYQLALKMLEHCLDVPGYHNNTHTFYNFVDWILYSYGSPLVDDISHVPVIQSAFWYENFRAQLMLMYPGDYFAELFQSVYGKGSNVHSFFPTPSHVATFMATAAFAGGPSEDAKYQEVCDPCCGTGALLLPASNHSLRITGIDIDENMVKMCTLNGYHYIPWAVENDEATTALLVNKGVAPEAFSEADFIADLLNKASLGEIDKMVDAIPEEVAQ